MKTFNGYEVVDAKARQNIANIHTPTKVSELENDKGYLTEHQDLSDYAKKTDIPNTSDFITAIPAEYVTETELNNKGYLTEHQSLTNYYTKAQTDSAIGEAISGIEITEPDLTGYATQQFVLDKVAEIDIPEVPKNVSAFTNDAGYLTEHQSLDGYAKTSDIPDVSKFITAIPDEYITETELNNKGYLTEHQSLDGYATEEYVDDAISKAATGDIDLSDYYTKSEVDDLIPTSYITDIPDYYVTETELNAKGYLTEHQSLAAYATKQYVTDSLTDVATKQYVDNAVANVSGGGSGETGSTTQKVYLDGTIIETTETPIPANLLEIFRQYVSGENRNYAFYFMPSASIETHRPASEIFVIPQTESLYIFFNDWNYYEEVEAADIDYAELAVRKVTIKLSSGTWKTSEDKAHLIKESAFRALEARVAALEGNN